MVECVSPLSLLSDSCGLSALVYLSLYSIHLVNFMGLEQGEQPYLISLSIDQVQERLPLETHASGVLDENGQYPLESTIFWIL